MTDLEGKDEWLLARERGQDISHVPAADRAPYEQLGALLGSGLAPSAGFRQRVLDAIDAAERAAPGAGEAMGAGASAGEAMVAGAGAGEAKAAGAGEVVPMKPKPKPTPPQPPWPWRWIAGGLVAAAAAATLVVVGMEGGRPPDGRGVELAIEIRPGGVVVRGEPARGEQARLGDTFVVRAAVTGPAEVRVYGGSRGQLLATCNDRGGCAIERDGERRRFVLEVPLAVPGTVRAVVFPGANVPASAGALDPDLEAAARAGIQPETRTPTPVR